MPETFHPKGKWDLLQDWLDKVDGVLQTWADALEELPD